MNIRRHLLSNVFRSPDDPAIDPPAGDPPIEPIAPAAPETAAAGDPPAAPEPPKAPENKPPGWWLGRLAEESEAKRQERERAETLSRENADLRARLEAGGNPPAPAPAQRQPAPGNEEFQRAVDVAADAKLMRDASMEVLQNGSGKFQDFEQTRMTLGALGALNDDFVADLIGADKANAHIILDHLAKNGEKAVSLVRMPTRQRIAEFVRMSAALAPASSALAPKPPAPAASKAPKPAPALAPVGDGGGDDPLVSDAGSDDDFSAAWDRKYKGSRAVA